MLLHFHKGGLQSPPKDWPVMALNILNVPLLSITLKAGASPLTDRPVMEFDILNVPLLSIDLKAGAQVVVHVQQKCHIAPICY